MRLDLPRVPTGITRESLIDKSIAELSVSLQLAMDQLASARGHNSFYTYTPSIDIVPYAYGYSVKMLKEITWIEPMPLRDLADTVRDLYLARVQEMDIADICTLMTQRLTRIIDFFVAGDTEPNTCVFRGSSRPCPDFILKDTGVFDRVLYALLEVPDFCAAFTDWLESSYKQGISLWNDKLTIVLGDVTISNIEMRMNPSDKMIVNNSTVSIYHQGACVAKDMRLVSEEYAKRVLALYNLCKTMR